MKKQQNIIKTFLISLFMALSLSSCDNKDDLQDIFIDRDWKLSFIQEGADKKAPDNSKGDYLLVFNNNTLTLTTPSNAKITGSWQAGNDPRMFRCSNMKINGNIENDDIAKSMYRILKEAKTYGGDTNWLQIIVQSGNIYMQFHNK